MQASAARFPRLLRSLSFFREDGFHARSERKHSIKESLPSPFPFEIQALNEAYDVNVEALRNVGEVVCDARRAFARSPNVITGPESVPASLTNKCEKRMKGFAPSFYCCAAQSFSSCDLLRAEIKISR